MKQFIISTRDLRLQFPKVTDNLRRGHRYLLIHRSKPLAEIRPILDDDLSVSEALTFFSNPSWTGRVGRKTSAVQLVRADRHD